jgi:glutathione peroxidase
LTIHDIPVRPIVGGFRTLGYFKNTTLLIVNVASYCGNTPQYEGLQELHSTYCDRGFTILGVPCNQFANEEPGTSTEIVDFCRSTYGVTFPLLEKTDVNGPGRHPLYSQLVRFPDANGVAGDVEWNFEKFLVDPGGVVAGRFRPQIEPDDPILVQAIEKGLP